MLRRRHTHSPIGIDIGASGIKMLQFSDEGGQPCVRAAVHHEFPPSQDQAGASLAQLECVIAEALRKHPFQGREVVAALGTSEFQIKSIRLPRMPGEELSNAVQFEAQDRFGFDGKSAQLRFIPAGEVRHGNELKEEIIVFAAPDERVRSRLGLLESCKLKPVALDVTPCAVARSFARYLRRAEDAQAVNVFLDLGWSGTSIIVTRGTDVVFLKVIDVGGYNLTAAVAKAMNISQGEAAELRIRIMHGASGRRLADKSLVSEEVRATVADAMRPLIERLARDVQLCLRYFAVTFRGQKPDSVTFVGGEAHEPAFSAIIGEAVDVPCTIGHPLRGVERAGLAGGNECRTLQPAWAVACGLALRGSHWVSTHGAAPGGAGSRMAAVTGN